MMKVSYLMGIRMEHDWLEQINVNLGSAAGEERWKEPIVLALQALEATGAPPEAVEYGTLLDPAVREEAFVVTIPPPQPKAKPPVLPPEPKSGPDIEIIIRPQK